MDAQLGVGVMHKCNRLSFFLSSFVPFLFSLFFPFSYSADDVWAEFEFQTVKLISQHGQGVSAVLDRVLRFPCLATASHHLMWRSESKQRLTQHLPRASAVKITKQSKSTAHYLTKTEH